VDAASDFRPADERPLPAPTPLPLPLPLPLSEPRPWGETLAWLLRALGEVEALAPSSSGALLLGEREQPLGLIVVERNRVCWAAAAGMSRRLRDILLSYCQVPLSDGELDALYARCRDERRQLGETLVAEGVVSAEQMRAAMKQHTVESLLALDATFAASDEGEWPLTWVERSGCGYNPSFTFGAAEVLAAVGAGALDETTAELVADHLDTLACAHCAGAAFACDEEGTPIVVGVLTALWLPLDELLDLCEWATAALAASSGFSPAMTNAWAHAADGGTVAWLYEGLRCAAVCPNNSSLQALVATLDHQSLAMVMATKHSVLENVRERLAFAAR
jgi:hypothetical protein